MQPFAPSLTASGPSNATSSFSTTLPIVPTSPSSIGFETYPSLSVSTVTTVATTLTRIQALTGINTTTRSNRIKPLTEVLTMMDVGNDIVPCNPGPVVSAIPHLVLLFVCSKIIMVSFWCFAIWEIRETTHRKLFLLWTLNFVDRNLCLSF